MHACCTTVHNSSLVLRLCNASENLVHQCLMHYNFPNSSAPIVAVAPSCSFTLPCSPSAGGCECESDINQPSVKCIAHPLQADVNVSLTSISLLWNASDLLGKLYTKARSSGSASSLDLEPDTNGNTGSPGAQLDSEQYQELVRLLYGALQVRPAPWKCCCQPPLMCCSRGERLQPYNSHMLNFPHLAGPCKE